MSIHRFTAIPLTPIHIGDGTVLSLEDYVLRAGKLARFQQRRVLADMSAPDRKRFLAALDSGQLREGLRILHDAVTSEDHIVEQVSITEAARKRIERFATNPLQQGRVLPFVRSGGRPYLPGSSIKGALRTALVSVLAGGTRRAQVATRLRPLGATAPQAASKALADALECAALDLGDDEMATDTDPFRFVGVADAVLPRDRTVVDVVENWRPLPPAAAGKKPPIPMQIERLRSRADGIALSFEVALNLRTEQSEAARARDAARLGGRRTPMATVRIEDILQATNDFHWRRFDEEREHFFAHEPATLALLRRVFEVQRGYSEDTVRKHGDVCCLLRIGRFGQFESKSVDGYRQGYEAKGRAWRPVGQPGSTRNVTTIATREGPARCPMGWLLLVRKG